MTVSNLHMVTFAVPYPANYGGAIDVWNRLVALKKEGVRIHLHCFVYGLFAPDPILKEVAAEVHYYPRVMWPSLFSKSMPYIVTSRKSQQLLKNLSKDLYPILFEGIHTTGYAGVLKNRKLLLRAHNIEHQYYAELANQCKGVKSLIFRRESVCLSSYEQAMARTFDAVFTISPHDTDWFTSQGASTVYLPPFHGFEHVDILPGRGQYVLYQGDLSIGINQEALIDLLNRMPPGQSYPVVAAGRSGDRAFEDKLTRFPNLRREADVSPGKMIDLIRQAQLILIHSLHGSGMKLKIFPALFHGRYVAATTNCRTNTSLDNAIYYYEPEAIAATLNHFWSREFTSHEMTERKSILAHQPDDQAKAKEILRYL